MTDYLHGLFFYWYDVVLIYVYKKTLRLIFYFTFLKDPIQKRILLTWSQKEIKN